MNFDVAIVGGGIFGLWAARQAIKRGDSVVVIDKNKVGSGASGGFLGALMPHMPDRWSAKKQMQFDALSTIEEAVRSLEKETGVDCGFKRCGRIMPMRHEKMLMHVEDRIKGAKQFWDGAFGFEYCQEEIPGELGGTDWLNPKLTKFGATYDTLSARINPRQYIKALASYAKVFGTLMQDVAVEQIVPDQSLLKLSNGSTVSAKRIVIANGYLAYPLLRDLDAKISNQPVTGRGVKGQAVLLEYEHSDNLPIIYNDGSYIVPHAGNRVAIGSTSLNDWNDPNSFVEENMRFYEHAMSLAPCLRDAPIIARWAGVRPRNTVADLKTGKVGTEPIVGPLDGFENISVAIGGFKISLGIGHHLTQAL